MRESLTCGPNQSVILWARRQGEVAVGAARAGMDGSWMEGREGSMGGRSGKQRDVAEISKQDRFLLPPATDEWHEIKKNQ